MKLIDMLRNINTDEPRWKNFGSWEFFVYIVAAMGYFYYHEPVHYKGITLQQANNFMMVFFAGVCLYLLAHLIVTARKNTPVIIRRICALLMLVAALAAPVVFIGSAVSPAMAVPNAFAFIAVIVTSLVALRNGVFEWIAKTPQS